MEELDEKALLQILTEPKNALVKQYTRLFEMENVKLSFEEAALKEIVKSALKRGTGARALRSIVEEVMLDIMYEIPSQKDIKQFRVTRQVLSDKPMPLRLEKKKSA